MGRGRSPSPRRDRDRERGRDRLDRDRERRRSRSHERERERGDRDRRDRHRRSRSRSPYRKRSRSPRRRSPYNDRRRSRSHSRDRDEAPSVSTRKPFRVSKPKVNEEELKNMDPESADMMRMMGFSGFDTTKGKQVEGNDVGGSNIILKRKFRQYMNRRGGFNRPLDFIA